MKCISGTLGGEEEEMGKHLCFCSRPLVSEGSPMGTHTLALAWSAAECGQSHGYDPHMGPLATQCHFSQLLVFAGCQTVAE